MNLPDAPIAQEGFFVTHFLTVADQAKSRDLESLAERSSGRKTPATSSWPTPGSSLILAAAPLLISLTCCLKLLTARTR